MQEKLNFKISSGLKSIIGKDLITDENVAIFELVKNSYDAGASTVNVYLDGNDESINRILIVDNGKGMSYQDITEKWLFVAYSAKDDGTEDGDERASKHYAGNKGIGRFSCDRLGASLRIQSKTKKDTVINQLDIDWGHFDKNKKEDFSKVEVSYSTSNDFMELPSKIEKPANGVILEITDLRDNSLSDWNSLVKLRRKLAQLIDPFDEQERKMAIDFYVKPKKIIEKAKEKINGPIINTIFRELVPKTAHFFSYLKDNGELICELRDRGILIYKTKEIVNLPAIFDVNFKLDIFYLNRAAKNFFTRRMNIQSVNYGSLFLFRNGFRVFPVGEPGNDSWGADRRKGQGYARYLGTRDIIGRVSVYGSEEKFKESSSRDQGLIDTLAYRELQKCVWICLRKLERYVVGVSWKDKLDQFESDANRLSYDDNKRKIIELLESLSKSRNKIEILSYDDELISALSDKAGDFSSSLDSLELIAQNTKNPALMEHVNQSREQLKKVLLDKRKAERIAEKESKAREEAQKRAEQSARERRKYEYAYEEEKKRSLFLSSQTTRDRDLLESFHHQIALYAANTRLGIENSLGKIKREGSLSVSETKAAFHEVLESINKIMVTSRFATSANFRLKSSNIYDDMVEFLKQYISNICTAYNSRISINVSSSDSFEFKKRFTPIELGMALDNLVNNSMKHRAKNINFDIRLKNNKLEIIVNDDGKGFSDKLVDIDRVFERGVTTTRGSGLGLYQVKKYLNDIGGEIQALQGDKGANFIIRVLPDEN